MGASSVVLLNTSERPFISANLPLLQQERGKDKMLVRLFVFLLKHLTINAALMLRPEKGVPEAIWASAKL